MYAVSAPRHAPAPVTTRPAPTWSAGVAATDGGLAAPVQAQHASPDHVQLGGSHLVEVGDHQLTTGQINALADYVAHPSDLARLTPAEIERALELIVAEPLTAEQSAELLRLFPDYEALSLANENHFGASDPALCDPCGSGGPTNRSEVASWLGQAFSCAAAAGRAGDAEGLDQALTQAAFGGHFIADAFSSGHLFNKADVLAAIAQGIAAAGPGAMPALVGVAGVRIAGEAHETLAAWRVVGPGGLRPVLPTDLMVLMGAVLAFLPEVFHNGVVLAIHDQLSVEGVDVTDGSLTWRMFGDHSLDPVSAARCSVLIEDVYAQVHACFARPDTVPSAEPFLARLPVPTGDEQARIHDVIARASTVAGGGMEDAVVAGSVAQLDTILSQANAFGIGPFVRVGGETEHPEHGAPTSDHPDAHDFSDAVGPWATAPAALA